MVHALKKRIAGFTLLETLLSSIIAVMILSSVAMFFLDILIFKERTQIEEELSYSMRFALHHFREEIKTARGVDEVSSRLGIHPGKLVLTFPSGLLTPRVLQSDGATVTLTRGNGSALSLLSSRVQVKTFMVRFTKPSQSSGLVTGTLSLQSTVDPEAEKTETFTITLLMP